MIKEIKCDFEIIEHKEKSNFRIEKKNIKIDFYDDELIKNVIDKKFNSKYKEILRLLAEDTENPDDSETIVLKIDELKRLIIDKYYHYLDKNSIKRYFKMLAILEGKLSLMPKKQSRGR